MCTENNKFICNPSADMATFSTGTLWWKDISVNSVIDGSSLSWQRIWQHCFVATFWCDYHMVRVFNIVHTLLLSVYLTFTYSNIYNL